VDKLETLEVSGTPEDIGFTIGQADADSIQKQVLQVVHHSRVLLSVLHFLYCLVFQVG